jgi:hypothetical protein
LDPEGRPVNANYCCFAGGPENPGLSPDGELALQQQLSLSTVHIKAVPATLAQLSDSF